MKDRGLHTSKKSHESSVAADEVVHGLSQVELADGWEDAERVARQEDDVLGVWPDAWDLRVGDVLDGVSGTSVLCKHGPDCYNLVTVFASIISGSTGTTLVKFLPVTDLSV